MNTTYFKIHVFRRGARPCAPTNGIFEMVSKPTVENNLKTTSPLTPSPLDGEGEMSAANGGEVLENFWIVA